MSATGLEVFDRTLHLTNTWLDEMMETVPPEKQLAWHALAAVLRTVRDRIPINLAAHLGAQLPMLVRGAYYDQWRPSDTPQNWRSAEEFLSLVSNQMGTQRSVSPSDAARAVFQVLNHHVDPNQVEKVRHALPEDVRALWTTDSRNAQPA